MRAYSKPLIHLAEGDSLQTLNLAVVGFRSTTDFMLCSELGSRMRNGRKSIPKGVVPNGRRVTPRSATRETSLYQEWY